MQQDMLILSARCSRARGIQMHAPATYRQRLTGISCAAQIVCRRIPQSVREGCHPHPQPACGIPGLVPQPGHHLRADLGDLPAAAHVLRVLHAGAALLPYGHSRAGEMRLECTSCIAACCRDSTQRDVSIAVERFVRMYHRIHHIPAPRYVLRSRQRAMWRRRSRWRASCPTSRCPAAARPASSSLTSMLSRWNMGPSQA